jgi:hypothetical protein
VSATGEGAPADPLAAALNHVLARRGTNHVAQDDLTSARRVREVAQVCWMHAGEPERLRSEDADRAEVCRELVRPWSRGRDPEKWRIANAERRARLRLVPPESGDLFNPVTPKEQR